MHWIYAAFVGLICGLIARFLLPGADKMGLIMTLLVGLGGAYVGTAIGHFTGMIKQDARAGWIWSIVGSILILIIIRMI